VTAEILRKLFILILFSQDVYAILKGIMPFALQLLRWADFTFKLYKVRVYLNFFNSHLIAEVASQGIN
jgi:hypothetical protein